MIQHPFRCETRLANRVSYCGKPATGMIPTPPYAATFYPNDPDHWQPGCQFHRNRYDKGSRYETPQRYGVPSRDITQADVDRHYAKVRAEESESQRAARERADKRFARYLDPEPDWTITVEDDIVEDMRRRSTIYAVHPVDVPPFYRYGEHNTLLYTGNATYVTVEHPRDDGYGRLLPGHVKVPGRSEADPGYTAKLAEALTVAAVLLADLNSEARTKNRAAGVEGA